MSNVLSRNFHGVVLKTSNGFSCKNAVKKLKKICQEKYFDFSCETARTGTCYIEISTEEYNISLRVGNHTRRNEDTCYIEYINKRVIKYLAGGLNTYDTYQIVNKSTFDLFLETLINLENDTQR